MNTSLTRTIAGVSIVLVGVALLLGNIGLFNVGNIFATYWPLLIVLGGVLMFMGNPKEVLFSLIVVIVGLLLQLRELNILNFSFGQIFWPAVIIFAGLAILFNRAKDGRPVKTKDTSTELFALFSGIDSKNHADDYTGGKVTAIAGGIVLDLREATIAKSANLEVFALMGGIELKVPKGVLVNVTGMPMLGGWDNKAEKPATKNPPVLSINATCVMGGVEIKN